MLCKQCGAENPDGESVCSGCGAALSAPEPVKIHQKKRRIIILSLCGLVLAAAILVLIFTLGAGVTPAGPWHNEILNQLIRFNEDGTAVIRTAAGDFEADYLFDAGRRRGVIMLSSEAIRFALDGDSLLLTRDGTQASFVRGEMEIAAEAVAAASSPAPTAAPAAVSASPRPTPTAAPAATPEQEPSVTVSETPEETPAEASTEAPTETPAEAPSEVPTVTPAQDPAAEDPGLFGQYPNLPGLFNDDIIGNILSAPAEGTWLQDTGEKSIQFNDNGTYRWSRLESDQTWSLIFTSTYTFDAVRGEVVILYRDGAQILFYVHGDELWSGMDTYYRQ